jgi:glucose/arabinose dehydrogenase/plastocyanin
MNLKKYKFIYSVVFLFILIPIMNPILLSLTFNNLINPAFGAYAKAPISPSGPIVSDENLTVETVADGLVIPTSMAFLNQNEILVTEKETGKVRLIVNGQLQETPILDVPVANSIERGLLGIAISNQGQLNGGKTFVFLSYTESGNDEDGSDLEDGVDPSGNRLYRYEYVDGQLVNPVLLLDLTAIPPNERGEHNGGKIRIGPDNNVYFMVGEVGGHRTETQNVEDGPEPNGLGGVIRITQEGDVVNDNISPLFGDEIPLSLYYAMGIRNSFGMDFDPVTGFLWDTENGPDTGDEINLVFPGFNSGWVQVQGFMDDNLLTRENTPSIGDLVYFGKSKYADPKFAWEWPIGITALKFLNSDKLGNEYQNDMFVGDINNGLLYRFSLNEERNNIVLDSTYSGNLQALQDNRIQDPKENLPLIFGQGFGGITDIQVGPDGYLYVLSYEGSLYKILPLTEKTKNPMSSRQSNDLPPVPNEDDYRLGAEGVTGQSIGDNYNNRANSIPVAIIGINGSKSYSPDPIEIEEGQTVTWYNGDSISHTVTSGEDNDSAAGSVFDSDAIIPNQYYSITFDDSGQYKYYCIYHPLMVGEVIVE